ncbi:pectate lyase [Paraflavisolibacter sp. H34]|uniref:pectate lyase family protein n=1 Tax=Huijunlia imazamoxiresistens TaxID=3127457 RepID=UPI0030198000
MRYVSLLTFFGLPVLLAAASCNKPGDATAGISGTVTTTTEGPTQVQEDALAFPGAEGYGKSATGGRGGKIIKVTNLNDAGPGSLRAALEAAGPRIVLFEVSGTIALKSRLVIKNGDLTVAGQTAPGDGICLRHYEVNVDADNVILRYLRFRMGDEARQQADALWGRYHQNLVIDHCSMSWSIDECASFYANKNFTMQWCILSESLNKSFHEKDDHGYGAIWGGTNASFHHNLLAHHNSRNPRFNGGGRSGLPASPLGPETVDFRNNVLYNWGANSSYGGENGTYNIFGNYYKPGPGTETSKRKRICEISMDADPVTFAPGFGTFYISGNYVDGNTAVSADNWNGGVDLRPGAVLAQARAAQPFAFSALTEQSAATAYTVVLAYAGASLKRDAVDTRVTGEVRAGTATYNGSKTGKKGIIDAQTDVGGWPELKQGAVPADTDGDGMPDDWEKAQKLDPKTANASGRQLSTAYDNIEVYCNSLVKGITEAQKGL